MQTTYKKLPACHYGNYPILSVGDASLYCAGFSRGADVLPNSLLIDLTEDMPDYHAVSSNDTLAYQNTLSLLNPTSILNLPIRDFDVPHYSHDLWPMLALDVLNALEDGKDALIACTGGHGRTGTVGAIIAHLIAPYETQNDPVSWIRQTYCLQAVETNAQVKYVFSALDLPLPRDIFAPASNKSLLPYTDYTALANSARKSGSVHCYACTHKYPLLLPDCPLCSEVNDVLVYINEYDDTLIDDDDVSLML